MHGPKKSHTALMQDMWQIGFVLTTELALISAALKIASFFIINMDTCMFIYIIYAFNLIGKWKSIRSPWGERSEWWIQMHNISATRQHVRACVEPTRPRLPLLWGSLVRKRLPRTLKYGNITDRIDHRSGLCVFLRSGKCDVASAILLPSTE